MAKFQSGDMVMANNGRGDCYMVNRVIPARSLGSHGVHYPAEDMYDLDNGAVHIKKRARSGQHPVAKIDRSYKKVS